MSRYWNTQTQKEALPVTLNLSALPSHIKVLPDAHNAFSRDEYTPQYSYQWTGAALEKVAIAKSTARQAEDEREDTHMDIKWAWTHLLEHDTGLGGVDAPSRSALLTFIADLKAHQALDDVTILAATRPGRPS